VGRDRLSQGNYSITPSSQENLLTPSEVAALFRVDPKTVTRWAKAGKLTSIKTLGGHRRYKESEVKALLNSISLNTFSNKVGGN
jgi:excisionase family DNA binding protein